jgi:hypothetical protein
MMNLWSKLGQILSNPSKPLPKPFDIQVHSRTFAALSIFRLNTSNSSNVKVVQFVEGHNFHVEWHFEFEV